MRKKGEKRWREKDVVFEGRVYRKKEKVASTHYQTVWRASTRSSSTAERSLAVYWKKTEQREGRKHIELFENTLDYLHFANTLDYFQKHWSDSKNIGVIPKTLDYLQKHWTISKYIGLFTKTLDYFQIHWTIFKYLQIQGTTCKYIRLFANTMECICKVSNVFTNTLDYLHFNGINLITPLGSYLSV